MARSSLQEEPTAEQVRELHNHIEQDGGWTRQRALDTRLRDLVFDEHAIETPNTAAEGRKRKIQPERLSTGEPARIINLITSMYPEPPQIGAQTAGESAMSEGKIERVGQAFNEAIDQLNPAADPPWPSMVEEMAIYGRAVELVIPGGAYYHDFPWKHEGEGEREWAKRHAEWERKAPLPVMWLHLPAVSTFPPSLSTVDDEVLSTKVMTWLDLSDMFDEDELQDTGMPELGDKKSLYSEVTLGMYSNRMFLAYVLLAKDKSGVWGRRDYKDKVLRVVPHGLNRCAIRIVPGLTTSRKEPPYYWRSVLYPVLGLLDAADRLMTRAATSAKFDAFPILQEHRYDTGAGDETGEGASGERKHELEGDVWTYHPGDREGIGREGIAPVFQPQHGDKTRELALWVLSRCGQMTGATPVLEGEPGPAGEPAWSTNIRGEFAKAKLKPFSVKVGAAMLDIAETVAKAVVSYGEPINLAKLDDNGVRSGTLRLAPSEMEKVLPILAVELDARVPLNFRADIDLMVSTMVTAKQHGISLSPRWLMAKLGGIDDPWQHYQEALEMYFLESEPIRKAQLQLIAEDFEASMAEEEGMSMEEVTARFSDLSPGAQQAIQDMFAQQRGPRVAPGVNPATAGALRAGNPLSARPGGPRPQEQLR